MIGVPHPDFGETVVGVLTQKSDEPIEANAIMDALKNTLARFKHPRTLVVIDTLPRNTMGKVQKNILRERYATMFTDC